ncbi:MAG TPA: DUF3376 domain-containing protein [Acidimicrobiales bacterium]|nr:DUF3376 domain-containing protein [Acidimicrobiales bacterium]
MSAPPAEQGRGQPGEREHPGAPAEQDVLNDLPPVAPAGPAPTLRLALAMRGGVSLSVWIGGAVLEIDTLRRALRRRRAAPNALAALAEDVGYREIELDVLSGASAGGLNGVVLATAMAADAPVDELRQVWLAAGDLQRLLQPSGWDTKLSLLNGEYFHDEVARSLTALVAGGRAPEGDEPARSTPGRLDLLLSVTSVVPSRVGASTDPRLPVVEQRIDGEIHLRHRAEDRYSDFVAFGPDGEPVRDDGRIAELALAARSTASFPFAFAPMRVDRALDGRVEVRPALPDPLLLYDGGVVDNMPVGKAARTIADAPAGGPTRRVLLYLHPSPGAPDVAAGRKQDAARRALRDGARPMDVLQSAIRSWRTKSLVDDLQALEAHNAAVARARLDRDRLLAQPRPVPVPVDLVDVAALDAERLVDLLVTPGDHLGACLPPVVRPSLLAGRPGDEVGALRRALAAEIAACTPRDGPSAPLPSLAVCSQRPWAPVARSAALLVEWCRRLEQAGGPDVLGAHKAELYRVLWGARRSADQLNEATLAILGDAPDPEPAALAAALVAARTPLVEGACADVSAAWCGLGATAARVSAVVAEDAALAAAVAAGPDGALAERLAEAGTTAEGVLDRLDTLDLVLLPLHRNGPTTALDEIRYQTLSGRADSPFAPGFPWPGGEAPGPADGVAGAGAVLSTLRSMPATPDAPSVAGAGALDPGSKLAGNQLHNFAAFLDATWRANDWMWGQLDAASSLTGVLLDDPGRRLRAEDVRRICTAPLPAPAHCPAGWQPDIDALVRSPWDGTDTAERVADELGGRDTDAGGGPGAGGARAAPLTRALLLWRRQLEILVAELGRAGDDVNPTGASPAATLRSAMAAWDGASRQLSDRWGSSEVTALGMRAAFVGWKALFARTGFGLRRARDVLAPLLAPIAGLLLARYRALVVIEVFLLGAVVPRTHDSVPARVTVALVAVAVAVAGLLAMRPRRADPAAGGLIGPPPGGPPGPPAPPAGTTVSRAARRRLPSAWAVLAAVLALAVVAYAIVVNTTVLGLDELLPPGPGHDERVWPYVGPVVAAMLATFVGWFWSRWSWRLVVTALSGVIIYTWVWLGGHSDRVPDALAVFASLWWGVVVGVLVADVIGYSFDTARNPPPGRRADQPAPKE